jgi:HK97 family phage portal protein
MGIANAVARTIIKILPERVQRMVKASAAQALISMQKLGQAVWTPRNYKNFAEEGYQKNIVAFKAIRELITAAEQAPWFVQKKVNGEWEEDESSDFAKLIARPNPQQSGGVLFGWFVGFYSISGNGYFEAVKSNPQQPPKELYTLRPDRMKVVVGLTGPSGYEYSVNGEKKTWTAEENAIRHLKEFNPVDDWYGMSPMEAAAFDIDIHNATLEWNKALVDNSMRPSGALVYDPKRESSPEFLSDENYERLKTQMNEKWQGRDNAGRPLLFEGALKWLSFMLSPADMDFINAKNTTARDICTAWGVPPQLLGIPGDATYSNLKEARQALWEQKILPLLYKIRDEINVWLAPQFGDYRLQLDEDSIPALSPRREELWSRLEKASDLTINEKREAKGYDSIEGGDQLYVSVTMIPIGSSPFGEAPPPAKAANEIEQ